MVGEQGFPTPDTPLVNPSTGVVIDPWLRFFLSVWRRTGGDIGDVVTTFNGRTGDVTLIEDDIETALGYLPVNPGALDAGWKGFVVSPSTPPSPPSSGFSYNLPAATVVIDGNIVNLPAISESTSA